MENSENLSTDARAYFLQQGQHISRLLGILSSNIPVHQVRRWLSILFEIVMYVLFLAFLTLAIWIPAELGASFHLNEETMLTMSITNDQVSDILFGMSCFIIICSLPLLAFAILLGRNRKKNRLILHAFHETEKMKKDFDEAVFTLKL